MHEAKSADELRSAQIHLFLFCVMLGIILFGYDLFSLGLSIDEEVDLYAPDPIRIWVSTGRWGVYVINQLFLPNPVTPVITQFIAIVFFAAAFVAVSNCWSKSIQWRHYAVAPIAVGFPTVPHIMGFQNLSYAVAIGYLLSTIAIFLIWRDRRFRYLLSIPLVTIALGMYQPILCYLVVVVLSTAAMNLRDIGIGDTFKKIVMAALVIVAAFILWQLVWQGSMYLAGVERGYVDQYIRMDVLIAWPYTVMATTTQFAFDIFFGYADIFLGDKGWMTRWLLIGSTSLAIFGLLIDRTIYRALSFVLIVLGVLSALFVTLIHYGALPYRTLLGIPIALAALVFYASEGLGKVLKPVMIFACAVCFVNFASISNQLAYAQHLSLEADKALVERVMERVALLTPDTGVRPRKLVFLGIFSLPASRAFPRVESSTYGASFFEWDHGSAWRIENFLRVMSYDYEVIGWGGRDAIAQESKNVPSWPAKGSVFIKDDMVVVKLSD